MLFPLRLPTFLIGLLLCTLFSSVSALTQTAGPATAFVDTKDVHSGDNREPLPVAEITIPGPLRSFLRMAGISQKASPAEVLPLLARNVYVQGYVGWQERGRLTEFMILLSRYVKQSKELAALAGPDGTIHVSDCEEALPLLHILGYRLRETCGQNNASLITADAERAFLTTDSGFPLPALENALRQNKPFTYSYLSARVPVLFSESDWTGTSKDGKKQTYDVVEMLVRHPQLARLYWALSRIDGETRTELRKSVGLNKLLPVAADLDFYGSHISI